MRRNVKILLGILILGSSVSVVVWLLEVSKERGLATTIKTEMPVKRDVVNKKVIAGNLVPCKEVALRADIAGILDKLYVSVGDQVRKGQAIAHIKLLPKSSDIEKARNLLRIAQIIQKEAEEKYQRSKQLFGSKMLSPEKYAQDMKAWAIACEKVNYAQKCLQFTLKGHIVGAQNASNIIKATTGGIVVELPCTEGSFVMERSSFQEGSTIATIADMSVLLFKGKVSEMEVAYLHPGMQFEISLIAIQGKKFPTTLTKIAPQALISDADKSIKFAIEGIVQLNPANQTTLRAGYTAIADVVLEKAINVLAIEEKWIHTEDTRAPTTPEATQGDNPYFVWVYEKKKKVKKPILLGVSDGIYVEVKKGLAASDQVIIEDDLP